VLYTGTGSTRNITDVGFQPDFTWIKSRSNGAYHHRLVDSVRGVTKEIYSNLTNAEGTDPNGLTTFLSNGFTLGSSNEYNASATTFVAWNWNAGGATVTNTAGSITSTVSPNTTSVFSIVTYTGNPAAEKTVGHGLGAVPKMIILKARNATANWLVYHESLGRDTYLKLNLTDAAAGTISNYWGSSGPTTTTFGLIGGGYGNNSSNTYVAYCWAEVAGYSRFGSYVGNGSADGPFVYCGFKPAFWMMKSTSAGSHWVMYDSKRNTYNQVNLQLAANLTDIESNESRPVDFLSNGVKIKFSSYLNVSGDTYIYAAFAETPFKYARAR
jgi:hypothetical protein